MDECLIILDDEMKNNKNKIYTPCELNNLLMNHINTIALNFDNISLIGDICECKIWKNSGMSFKLINGNKSFECKVWLKDGLTIEEVKKHENLNCIIKGYLTAEYYYNHKFVLNSISLKKTKNNSKINELKKMCNDNNFFNNKKLINWENIKKIGIISKINTQGYNDFMEQFKLPIDIIIEEINLEGNSTSGQCISSISKLQSNDLIIIIRGGGSTSEISNSYDKYELFKVIRESKKPIITAIGHENDKGDKLLINEISDVNYSTPSTASYEINYNIIQPIILKIKKFKLKIKRNIDTYFENKKIKNFKSLLTVFKYLKKIKIGTEKIYKIEQSINYIIIEKNGCYYKNKLSYDNIFNIDKEEINRLNDIENEMKNNKIMLLKQYILNYKVDEDDNNIINKIVNKIKIILTKIKDKNKLEIEYNKNESILDISYIKKYYFSSNITKIKDLLSLYKNCNYLIDILVKGNKDDIKKIYNFTINYI